MIIVTTLIGAIFLGMCGYLIACRFTQNQKKRITIGIAVFVLLTIGKLVFVSLQ